MADRAYDAGTRGLRHNRAGRAYRRARPLLAPLGLAAAAAAGSAYLLLGANPHDPNSLLPACPWRWATGFQCPACGGTRMAYDLLHGDLAAAFTDNPVLLVLGVPTAAFLFAGWLRAGIRGERYQVPIGRHAQTAILAIAALWVLARNLVI